MAALVNVIINSLFPYKEGHIFTGRRPADSQEGLRSIEVVC